MAHGSRLLILCLTLGLLAGCAQPATSLQGTDQTAPRLAPVASSKDQAAVQQMLRAELTRQLAARGITLDAAGRPLRDGKAVSSLPPRIYQTPSVQVNPITNETQLYWTYEPHGDYDLNGEVNISDITPVGQYFHAKSGDANWGQAQAADGDGNGEVNIADITPIGASFGVRTEGFVVEAREAAGDWREYGNMEFSAGFPTGVTLEYGYDVPSGPYEAEYRLAPVGGMRDFAWDTYILTDAALGAEHPQLAVADGKPVLAFVDMGSLGFTLGFAVATESRPASVSDWSIEPDLSVSNAGDMPCSLAVNQGKPCLAYCAFNGATYDTDFKVRDAGAAPTSTWSTLVVATSAVASTYVELTMREGRPQLLSNGFGLKLMAGQTAFPANASEWTWISANPSLGNFDHIDAVCSGPLLFACGIDATGPNLVFNLSKVPAPTVPADFSEYILNPVGSTEGYPSLVLIGGLPCVAFSNYADDTLYFLMAPNRIVDSAASWFMHDVVTGSSEFRNPCMALVEGKPAIVAGATTLDFHWTGGQFQDSKADWHTQQITSGTAPGGVSMVVIDGLPIVAYCVNPSGPSNIAIAVAREQ